MKILSVNIRKKKIKMLKYISYCLLYFAIIISLDTVINGAAIFGSLVFVLFLLCNVDKLINMSGTKEKQVFSKK